MGAAASANHDTTIIDDPFGRPLQLHRQPFQENELHKDVPEDSSSNEDAGLGHTDPDKATIARAESGQLHGHGLNRFKEASKHQLLRVKSLVFRGAKKKDEEGAVEGPKEGGSHLFRSRPKFAAGLSLSISTNKKQKQEVEKEAPVSMRPAIIPTADGQFTSVINFIASPNNSPAPPPMSPFREPRSPNASPMISPGSPGNFLGPSQDNERLIPVGGTKQGESGYYATSLTAESWQFWTFDYSVGWNCVSENVPTKKEVTSPTQPAPKEKEQTKVEDLDCEDLDGPEASDVEESEPVAQVQQEEPKSNKRSSNKNQQEAKDDDELCDELLAEMEHDKQNAETTRVFFELIPLYEMGDTDVDKLVNDALKDDKLDLDCRDKNGNTLLIRASEFKKTKIVSDLLKKGISVNARNDLGFASLHYACYQSSLSIDVAKLLLEHGAKPDIADNSNCTPLHYAASEGSVALVALLLFHKARPDLVDWNGYTALDYASQSKATKCVNLIQATLDSTAEWKQCVDPETNYTYWYNSVTGVSQWEKPNNEKVAKLEESKAVQEEIRGLLNDDAQEEDDDEMDFLDQQQQQEKQHKPDESIDQLLDWVDGDENDIGVGATVLEEEEDLQSEESGFIEEEPSVMFQPLDEEEEAKLGDEMDTFLDTAEELCQPSIIVAEKSTSAGPSSSNNKKAAARSKSSKKRKERKLKLYCNIGNNDIAGSLSYTPDSAVLNTASKTYDCFNQVFTSKDDIFQDSLRSTIQQTVATSSSLCILLLGDGQGKTMMDESTGILFRAMDVILTDEVREKAKVYISQYECSKDGLIDLQCFDTESEKVVIQWNDKTPVIKNRGEKEVPCDAQVVKEIIGKGLQKRQTFSAFVDEEGTKSHLICGITLEDKTTKSKARLTFVNLADDFTPDKSIHRSLCALGNVLRAIVRRRNPLPIEQDDLTILLNESLQKKTICIVNMNDQQHVEQRLHFADKIKREKKSKRAPQPSNQ